MSDDPRGFRNGLWLRHLFPLFDAFAVTPALLTAFFLGCGRRPVTLLRLPPRPLPRRLPAFWAAIALVRRHGTKTPLTAFQQTGARPRPAGWAFPSAVLLHWGEMSRILNRAHGSMAPGKLMPRRGPLSSPGRSQLRFTANSKLYRKRHPGGALGFLLRPLIRRFGAGMGVLSRPSVASPQGCLDRAPIPALSDGQEDEAKSPCRLPCGSSFKPASVIARQCRHPLFAACRRLAR